ncbi:MAG: hypothetical protein EPN86_01995 [Nanoarchaeota archaeon]|nr:MAG: hypothetical protein EPN86_01995 [Nanoarchaeota archaeon]
MVEITDSNLSSDITESLENMQNYLIEKLAILPHWPYIDHKPKSLSNWVHRALQSELPFAGAILLERINETKQTLASRPQKEHSRIVDGLWQEIYDHLNQ